MTDDWWEWMCAMYKAQIAKCSSATAVLFCWFFDKTYPSLCFVFLLPILFRIHLPIVHLSFSTISKGKYLFTGIRSTRYANCWKNERKKCCDCEMKIENKKKRKRIFVIFLALFVLHLESTFNVHERRDNWPTIAFVWRLSFRNYAQRGNKWRHRSFDR